MDYKNNERAAQHEIYAQTVCSSLLDRCKALRAEKMLSLREVASIVGLAGHSNLSAIEQGKKIPRVDTLLRLLSVYGYTLKIVRKE